jgi:putative SOS response-associated peptidase YedK
MCNRYRPASITFIRDVFGFTLIEEGYAEAIGPLQLGPFIVPGRAMLGQWGLIPHGSKSRRPTRADGKPMSTNNCRRETVATAWSFRGPWARGQRCLIPAMDYDEPYWGTGKNIWWRFGRADGQPWALAGIWSDWTDHETRELVPSYTMLTQNCDQHPLLNRFHKPDPSLPADKQDKRAVVPIEREHWDEWLHGSIEQAAALIRLPSEELFRHGPADPAKQAALD